MYKRQAILTITTFISHFQSFLHINNNIDNNIPLNHFLTYFKHITFPVSYTHLDVYKRQGQERVIRRWTRGEFQRVIRRWTRRSDLTLDKRTRETADAGQEEKRDEDDYRCIKMIEYD